MICATTKTRPHVQGKNSGRARAGNFLCEREMTNRSKTRACRSGGCSWAYVACWAMLGYVEAMLGGLFLDGGPCWAHQISKRVIFGTAHLDIHLACLRRT